MIWSMAGRIGLIVLVLVGLLAVTGLRLNAAAEVEVTQLTDAGDYSFFATGFKDNETVSTWLTGPAGQVMATDNETATDRGKARFDMHLPRHFEPGRWAITVHGLKSDSEAVGWFDLPVRGP